MKNYNKDGKVKKMSLVITSESVKQNKGAHPAKELFRGTLFKITKKFCEKKGYEYVIVSFYKGLIFPNQKINSYKADFHKHLSTKQDTKRIERLREKIIPKLKEILPKYKEVIVIAGRFYRELLQPVWDERFTTIKAEGYGDLLRKIKEMI